MYKTEVELIRAFISDVENEMSAEYYTGPKWTFYHETAGWDLLMVSDTGVQVGVEAKLTLNAKVLVQCLPNRYSDEGPDFRVALVPDKKYVNGMPELADALGIQVIIQGAKHHRNHFMHHDMKRWQPWFPASHHPLPEYIPDVEGGKASPVKLSPWKIKAIKLLIVLDRKGSVTRKDMRLLDISPTLWTGNNGYLDHLVEAKAYARSKRTPDLRSQHPINFSQIEKDFNRWCPKDIKATIEPSS